MLKKLKERDGFTFVELIAVLMIIVILAAVTTPQIFGYVETARRSSAIAGARNVISAIQTVGITKGDITEITVDDLKVYFSNIEAVNVTCDTQGIIRVTDNQELGLTSQIELAEGKFAISSVSSTCTFTYYQKLSGKIYAVKCVDATVDTTSVAVFDS